MKVKPVIASTSTITIQHLHSIFATPGLAGMLITDNSSVFTSEEFKTLLNRIESITQHLHHTTLYLMDLLKGVSNHWNGIRTGLEWDQMLWNSKIKE